MNNGRNIIITLIVVFAAITALNISTRKEAHIVPSKGCIPEIRSKVEDLGHEMSTTTYKQNNLHSYNSAQHPEAKN